MGIVPDQRNARRGNNECSAKSAGILDADKPLFEPEAIRHERIGFSSGHEVARRRIKTVRRLVGPNERRNDALLPGHGSRKIGQLSCRGDYPNRSDLRRRVGDSASGERNGNAGQKDQRRKSEGCSHLPTIFLIENHCQYALRSEA